MSAYVHVAITLRAILIIKLKIKCISSICAIVQQVGYSLENKSIGIVCHFTMWNWLTGLKLENTL